MRIVAIAGGVGGGRFLRGLIDVVDSNDLTIIGNVGDDLEILSLHVSPDLDSVLYALADLADERRGWGRADESWRALETVADLDGPAWFKLGERDLGLHLIRTQMLRDGWTLAEVTAHLTRALGVQARLIPATNDPLRTFIQTEAGTFPFQTWFVERGHRDEVDGLDFAGAESATAAPGVLEALAEAELIIITPSNPYVSILPTLAIPSIAAALRRRAVPCVAVSPLITGRAVKGPADRMLRGLAGGTTPEHVARAYAGAIDVLVYDHSDGPIAPADGVEFVAAETLMVDSAARSKLARAVLEVGEFMSS